MAKVEIRFEYPVQASGGPIHNANASSAEIMTSSASTQTSTAAATHSGQTVSVTSSGGAVRITIGGGTLDAATGTTLIPDGATRSFGSVAAGHKVAIIDLA
jgi:hypothetical protein